MGKRLKNSDVLLLFPLLLLAKLLSNFFGPILCVCEPVHLFPSLSLFERRVERLAKRQTPDVNGKKRQKKNPEN